MPRREILDGARRQRVLLEARRMLRRRSPIHVPRKQIAEAADVAPSLVTYYFKDEASLIEAAVKPIVHQYLARLKEIVASTIDLPTMLRSIILLFLEIARDNGQLLESYITFVKQNGIDSSTDFLRESYFALQQFFELCERHEHVRRENFAFIQTAIWGICKTVAQTSELERFLHDSPATPEEIIDKQATLILTLIGHGLTNRAGEATAMWGVFSGQDR